jgi:hypothetical protein
MYTSKFFSFIASVVDTADNFHSRKSPQILTKFETVLMEHSGAQGTLIHEINLKLKISGQTPFN